MVNEVNLSVPKGFTFKEDYLELDKEEAGRILYSDEIGEYTSAVHRGDKIVLEKHTVKCPACKSVIPGNAPYWNTEVKREYPSRNVIDEFLRETEGGGGRLVIDDRPILYAKYLTCPSCGRSACGSDEKWECTVSYDDRYIEIKCELNGAEELFLPHDRPDFTVKGRLYHVLRLDLEKGSAEVCVLNGDNIIKPRIIDTFKRTRLTEPCLLVLGENNMAETVRNIYEIVTGYAFPLKVLNAFTLYSAVKFIGYSSRFYSSIPIRFCRETGEGRIGEEYRDISERLHRAENVPKLYDSLFMPKDGSVRAVILRKPELLFYYEEIKALYGIIGKPELFAELMNQVKVIETLQHIHSFPLSVGYYKMLREVLGTERLCHIICTPEDAGFDMEKGSLEYSGMDEVGRERMKQRYIGEDYYYISPSYPIATQEDKIPECVIDGYEFVWVKNYIDQHLLGAGLSDEYVSSMPFSDTGIIGIRKGGRCVAAISLCGDTVDYFSENYREKTDKSPSLGRAYDKWREMYGIKEMGE